MSAMTDSAGEYLAAVRKHLADLPPDEVADILADISPQIQEAAGESDVPLAERLGPPRQYAEELRAAAGFPSPPLTGAVIARFAVYSLVFASVVAVWAGYLNMWATRQDARAGIAPAFIVLAALLLGASVVIASRLGSSVSSVVALPEVQWARTSIARAPAGVRAYYRSVQPGWWLARGLLIALPVLTIHGPSALWVVFLLAQAVLAVLVGPRTRTDRRWLWISVPITGYAIGTAVLLLAIWSGNEVTLTGDGISFMDRWPM
jgi:uncharacterized membrane protein